MNRVDRLMSILLTLQSRKFVQAEDLAEKYDLSLRTIYRDVKALNEIGIPIYFEPNKGYGILEGHFLPPLLFTLEEASSLLLLRELANKFADQLVLKNSDVALEKIKAVLKSHDKERIEQLTSKIEVHVPQEANVIKDDLTKIQHAIIDKRVLSLNYIDNNHNQTQRTVEPIGLIFYSDQWHLIAWCNMREAYRDFKLKGIKQLHITSDTFTKEHTFSIQDYMKIF